MLIKNGMVVEVKVSKSHKYRANQTLVGTVVDGDSSETFRIEGVTMRTGFVRRRGESWGTKVTILE